MLFNSIDFAIFLPTVFLLYWFVFRNSLKAQNVLIVVSSYVFYGWWDWRFLSLIAFSTLVDFFVGIGMEKKRSKSKRKILLLLSVVVNLGLLGFFKYYNFFIDNFVEVFSLAGQSFDPNRLSIILPVGISFYTFQTLSYTIDVYREKLKPTKSIIEFAAFVSFFPQLVAGPIERATNLLPQFYVKRKFDYAQAVDGMRQILWGLFKKIVIADNCAQFANEVFSNSAEASGSTLLAGVVFFAFQIYGDFSGYSDIAIGTSRLFGFNLMQNFAFPYFSRDIAEFWRRWHISLSSWFRDYLYIPLGGSKGGIKIQIRNIFIIFIVSGFWHGANWTFIVWGALNALFFLPLFLTKNNRLNMVVVAQGRTLPSPREIALIVATFGLTCIAWVFFRADSVSHAMAYLNGIFSYSFFSRPLFVQMRQATLTTVLVLLFIIIEWHGREEQYAIEKLWLNWDRGLRIAMYYSIVLAIYFFSGTQQQFIYFQF